MAAKVEEAYSERTEKVNAAGEMVEVNLDRDRPRETPVFQAAGGREGGEVALGSRELGAAISMGTWLSIGEAILV